MDAAPKSPAQRRALAPLDANTLSSPKSSGPAAGRGKPDASPLRKRAVETAAAAVASPRPQKKICVEDDANIDARSRSGTPEDESSLFDTNDASWASNSTPDMSPAPRVLTRQQAREKAEILRLRLGLASYKVRTGQTAVPLANLVAKPLRLGGTGNGEASTQKSKRDQGPGERGDKSAVDDGEEEEGPAEGQKAVETEDKEAKGELRVGNGAPELPLLRRSAEEHTTAAAAAAATPRRNQVLRLEQEQERLTSSALRGGAASGLLSLARGESAE